jgi:lysophospholipase L1-like esterase
MKKKLFIFGVLSLLVILTILGAVFYSGILKYPVRSSSVAKTTHTLIFLGDSMTEYLGNLTELNEDLKKYYPDRDFLLLNYGFGSTNILSAEDRITLESTHSGRIFKPINDIPFDYIFIESFGNNPLSHLPLEEGLKKQTESLDRLVETLETKHPKESIIFVLTIAPNRNRYGEGVVNLMPDKRHQWADERIAYMKNHIKYAKDHSIPLINIYEKSLKDGDGNIDYLNTNDFIHPSSTGIIFISEQIADFIYQNNLIK